MINVYKSGGQYKKKDGTEYSIKTINEADKSKLALKGWVSSLDLVEAIEEAVFEEVVESPVKQKPKTTKGA